MARTQKCGNCAPVIELCEISVTARQINLGPIPGGAQCQLVIQAPFCIDGFTCGDVPLTPLRLTHALLSADGSISLLPVGGNKPSFSLGVPVWGGSHFPRGVTSDIAQANKFTDEVCCEGLTGDTRYGQPFCTACCDFLSEALKRRLANGGGLYLGNKSCDEFMSNLDSDDYINKLPAGGNAKDQKICHSCTVTMAVPCHELTSNPLSSEIESDRFEWYVNRHTQDIANNVLSELRRCIQGIFSTPGFNTWDRTNGTLDIARVKLDPTQQESDDYDYWLSCRAACLTTPPGSMCCTPR